MGHGQVQEGLGQDMGTQIEIKCDRCGKEDRVELEYNIWENFLPNRFDMTPGGMKAFSSVIVEMNDVMLDNGFRWCSEHLICNSCYEEYQLMLSRFKQERADRIGKFWDNGSISA